jgi:hypothetical protein
MAPKKTSPAKTDKPAAAYDYLRARANDQKPFTVEDLANASGWSVVSVKTYLGKSLGQLVERAGNQKLLARRELLRLSKEKFLGHMTQKKPIFSEYTRTKHENILSYVFLLPLTREDKLRRALDDLFFSDTILRRLREVGVKRLETLLPRELGISDDAYLNRILSWAGRVAGGYSVNHTSGRFRASDLRSRKDAGEMLADDRLYLVDETTALVRFFVPLDTGSIQFGGTFEETVAALEKVEPSNLAALGAEVKIARVLFFQLFVEAVVRTISGEDEIWLIEEGPAWRRLYRWTRQ